MRILKRTRNSVACIVVVLRSCVNEDDFEVGQVAFGIEEIHVPLMQARVDEECAHYPRTLPPTLSDQWICMQKRIFRACKKIIKKSRLSM